MLWPIGDGLQGLQIANFHAPMVQNINQAFALKYGQFPAHRLERESCIVCNIEAAHTQFENTTLPDVEASRHCGQESRHALLGGVLSE